MSCQRVVISKERKKKKIILLFLYLGTTIIMFLGAYFSAFSVLNHINIRVLEASVPGIVFGLLVLYLGLRYFFMVSDFKTDFYQSNARFSWSNFKKEKKDRKIHKSKIIN